MVESCVSLLSVPWEGVPAPAGVGQPARLLRGTPSGGDFLGLFPTSGTCWPAEDLSTSPWVCQGDGRDRSGTCDTGGSDCVWLGHRVLPEHLALNRTPGRAVERTAGAGLWRYGQLRVTFLTLGRLRTGSPGCEPPRAAPGPASEPGLPQRPHPSHEHLLAPVATAMEGVPAWGLEHC